MLHRGRPDRRNVPATHGSGRVAAQGFVDLGFEIAATEGTAADFESAGIPVATVSVAGARNAGLLAVRMLGAGEGEQAARLRERLAGFADDLRDQAHAKGERLRERRTSR